jgi:hypothetical protein
LSTAGCGVQATAGPEWAGHGTARLGITTTGTLQALRDSNSVVALRVNSVAHDGYSLKSAMLHGGYDMLCSRLPLAFEPGIDLGIGQAARPVFGGTGAYGGISSTFRLRPWPWTIDPSYDLAFPMIELVIVPRIGLWMPPESSGNATLYGEGGVEFGLRIALGSDLATTDQGHVWDGGPSCKGNGGSHDKCHQESP